MTLLDLTPRTATAPRLDALPVVVIGAGPIGLAAAANLVERGIDVVVLEAGEEPAAAVRRWGHIRLFSPWRHLVDPASRRLLEASGWTEPDADAAPTGRELVDAYVAPLAELKPLRSRIRYGSRVLAVAREGMDRTRSAGRETTPFVVRYATADGVVEFAGRQNGYGNVVILQHAGKYSTLYAHQSRIAPGLKKGDRVSQGQVIGYVGSTGWATGPHLHYEFRIAGTPVDPLSVTLPVARKLEPREAKAFAQAVQPYKQQIQMLAQLHQTPLEEPAETVAAR